MTPAAELGKLLVQAIFVILAGFAAFHLVDRWWERHQARIRDQLRADAAAAGMTLSEFQQHMAQIDAAEEAYER